MEEGEEADGDAEVGGVKEVEFCGGGGAGAAREWKEAIRTECTEKGVVKSEGEWKEGWRQVFTLP